jgi:hypothetical protein
MPPNQLLLQSALEQFRAARKYTLALVDGFSPEQWFWVPTPPVSHVAWQIGHLAVAQYGLMLFRQRGRLLEDADLLPSEFRKAFAKGTNPQDDSKAYPPPNEILAVLRRVNDQVEREAGAYDPARMDDPTDPPHAGPATRLGSLMFAAHHEMLHGGQIGLLRRLMGLNPLR